jgi:hypothetical protein
MKDKSSINYVNSQMFNENTTNSSKELDTNYTNNNNNNTSSYPAAYTQLYANKIFYKEFLPKIKTKE